VRESSIAKHAATGPETPFAIELGATIRRQRLAQGLTQAELGEPLTRAFVSGVERGRFLPSLGSLYLLSGRLGLEVQELLALVNQPETTRILRGHARNHEAADRRR
jgi:transcriptional regulator with XRE-family HTH domain